MVEVEAGVVVVVVVVVEAGVEVVVVIILSQRYLPGCLTQSRREVSLV